MRRFARPVFAITALLVVLGVGIETIVSGTNKTGLFDAGWERVLNHFTYFTVMSNLLVGGTCAALAFNPNRSGRWFDALRLDGLICILVTALVYHGVLATDHSPEGWNAIGNFLEHTAVPIIAIVGWLAFDPRGRITNRTIRLSLVIPVGWMVFTLVRGAIAHHYPYGFLDVDNLGYAKALLNIGVITAIFIGLAVLARPLDRLLDLRNS